MAMRRRNFGTKKTGTDDVVILDINADTEIAASFRCNSKIPGMVLVDFISDMDEDNPASMGIALKKFFDTAIAEVDRDAFYAYVRDPKHDVELDQLAEMAGWLSEQYSGENPTVQSPDSSGGYLPNGTTSTDSASVPV